jgi:hypothetical protein
MDGGLLEQPAEASRELALERLNAFLSSEDGQANIGFGKHFGTPRRVVFCEYKNYVDFCLAPGFCAEHPRCKQAVAFFRRATELERLYKNDQLRYEQEARAEKRRRAAEQQRVYVTAGYTGVVQQTSEGPREIAWIVVTPSRPGKGEALLTRTKLGQLLQNCEGMGLPLQGVSETPHHSVEGEISLDLAGVAELMLCGVQLPSDVAAEVAAHLDLKALCALRCTSKQTRQAAYQYDFVRELGRAEGGFALKSMEMIVDAWHLHWTTVARMAMEYYDSLSWEALLQKVCARYGGWQKYTAWLGRRTLNAIRDRRHEPDVPSKEMTIEKYQLRYGQPTSLQFKGDDDDL